MFLKEVGRLRQERDELREEIASLRRGGLAPVPAADEADDARPPFDLQAAVAQEMRAMLVALLEEIRTRPVRTAEPSGVVAPPEPLPLPAVEIAVLPTETAEPLLDRYVEEPRQPELPPRDEIESEDVLAETSQPLVDEHVDELATSTPEASEASVDEYVEEPREPEPPIPGGIPSEDVLAETSQPIVDEYVEEFRKPAAPPEPSEALARDAVEVEPPKRVFDEYVEEFVERDIVEPDIAEPVGEYVEELRAAEAPPASEIEIDLSPEPSEPIVDEYVEELRRPETLPEPETPAADANIEALWEAAATPITEAEPPRAPLEATAPIIDATPAAALPPLEPASFITDEFIEATRPGSPHETASAPPPFIDLPAPSPFVEHEAPFTELAAPQVVEPSPSPAPGVPAPAPALSSEPTVRQIQVLISPIHSFPRLSEIQERIQSLSSVQALRLRDFRNGVATFVVSVAEAISPQEFGAVIQMLENLHLRLEGTAQNSVELRVENDTASR